jgi:hypothetical protein
VSADRRRPSGEGATARPVIGGPGRLYGVRKDDGVHHKTAAGWVGVLVVLGVMMLTHGTASATRSLPVCGSPQADCLCPCAPSSINDLAESLSPCPVCRTSWGGGQWSSPGERPRCPETACRCACRAPERPSIEGLPFAGEGGGAAARRHAAVVSRIRQGAPSLERSAGSSPKSVPTREPVPCASALPGSVDSLLLPCRGPPASLA